MRPRILVVENDELTRKSIATILENADYSCLKAVNRAEVFGLFQSGEDFDLLLVPATPTIECEALLGEAKRRFPEMPVIVLAALNDAPAALNAIRRGAYGLSAEPFRSRGFAKHCRRALEHTRLKLENRAYQTNLEELVAARTEQLRQAITTLEQSYDITLEALGNALDLKDAETGSHSKRVTAYAIGIARAMGIRAAQITVIARGAFLHDIGKIAIPPAILLKPGALDPEEFAIVKEHCRRGYGILGRIPFVAEAARDRLQPSREIRRERLPSWTQEKDDPAGGENRRLGKHPRRDDFRQPYRTKRPSSVARDEIRRWSGRQFDPQVVDTFLQMPEHIWSDLRKNIQKRNWCIPLRPRSFLCRASARIRGR